MRKKFYDLYAYLKPIIELLLMAAWVWAGAKLVNYLFPL